MLDVANTICVPTGRIRSGRVATEAAAPAIAETPPPFARWISAEVETDSECRKISNRPLDLRV